MSIRLTGGCEYSRHMTGHFFRDSVFMSMILKWPLRVFTRRDNYIFIMLYSVLGIATIYSKQKDANITEWQ